MLNSTFPQENTNPIGLPDNSLTSQNTLEGENDFSGVSALSSLEEREFFEILGTVGRDILEGTEADERIIGGFGRDILNGGDGLDIFVYQNLRDAGDIIREFERQQDKIDLTDVLTGFGYTGLDPLEDGYVALRDYNGGTQVLLDADGLGGRPGRPFIFVEKVTADELGSFKEHFCPHPIVENEPPTIELNNLVESLNENVDTTNSIKVAEIIINDDGEGENTLKLTGDDADSFVIVGGELFLKAGIDLNFEDKSVYDVTVEVDDTEVGTTPDDAVDYSLSITNINEPPSVELNNLVESLNENTDTTNSIKVAEVIIIDDGIGTNNLNLTGNDADSFVIVEGELFLKAGIDLNFEDKSVYDVTVEVDDTEVGTTPDDAVDYSLSITNVNEPPSVELNNLVESLNENVDTTNSIKVADIIINDDGIGTNNLDLTGNDADSFVIVGGELFLKAGIDLNFEDKSVYDVTVEVDDTEVGTTPDDAVDYSLSITNVNKPPIVDENKTITVLEDSGENPLNITPPTDPDNDPLTISITEIPDSSQGIITLNNNPVTLNQTLTSDELQQLVFIPANGVSGNGGTFSYLVEDGQGGNDTQTITFNISPVVITLREEDNFKVVHEETITIPETPSIIRFTYESLSFDFTDTNSINDAFEVALLDSNSDSLVYTIDTDKDAFFNTTEGQEIVIANGVEIDGNTISVDIGYLLANTEATLVFRLVNNDSDTETSVRISDLEIVENENPTTTGITPNTNLVNVNNTLNFSVLEDVSNSVESEYKITSFNEDSKILSTEINLKNSGTYGLNNSVIVAIDNISNPNIRVVGADGITPEGLPYYDFTNLLNNGKLDPGQNSGSKTLSFFNPQEIQFDYELVFLAQLNAPPEFITTPNTEAIAGQEYQYQAQAKDPDEDPLTYNLVNAPKGMSINTQTGGITWTPETEGLGNYRISIEALDGRGGVTNQEYTLSVIEAPPNRPPIFTSTPIVDARVNRDYQYQAIATDPDGNDLTYSLIQAPTEMSINPNNGLVTWSGDDIEIGNYQVEVGVDDGQGGVAQQIYDIVVLAEEGNNRPVFISTPVTEYNLPALSNPPVGETTPNRLDLSLSLGETLTETVSLTLPIEGGINSADVVFVVDESGSMVGEHEWLADMVLDLDQALQAQGITNNRYALAGFGGGGIREPGHLFGVGSDFNISLSRFSNEIVDSANFGEVIQPLQVELMNDGTYAIIIDSDADLSTIDYEFTITDITETLVTPSGFNQLESGTLAPGEERVFNLTASAGLPIYFDSLDANNGAIQVVLTDANNQAIFRTTASRDTNPIILENSGEYTLTLTTFTGGDYRFRLQEFSSAEELNFNQVINENLAARATKIYQFTGEIGNKIYYDGLETDEDTINARLYQANGDRLFTINSENDNNLITLEESGQYYLLLDNNQDSEGDYNFQLLDTANAEILTLDTPTQGILANGRETKIYQFVGEEGQRFYFDAMGSDNSGSWSIYSSSNNRIITNSLTRDAKVALDYTGDYTLVISGNSENPVNYNFNLVDASTNNNNLTLNQVINSNIAKPGEQDQYSFTGTIGQRLYYDAINNASGISGQLISPSGATIFNRITTDTDTFTLKENGTYRLIFDGSSDNTGEYSFQLLDNNEINNLILDTLITDSLNPGRSTQLYQFTVEDNQRLYYENLGSDSGNWEIYNSANERVANGSLDRDSEFTLDNGGSYILAVQGNSENPVNYNFNLVDASTNNNNFTLNQVINGSITKPGKQDQYSFTGTIGQRLYYDAINNASGISGQLISPSSATIFNRITTDTDTFTLKENGTYRLIFDGSSDNTGEYSFQLLDNNEINNLILDTPITDSLNPGRSTQLYQFTVEDNQRLYYENLGSDSGNWEIYNSANERVANGSLDRDSEFTLDNGGSYILAVQGNSENPVNYNFNLVDASTNNNNLTLNQVINGSIAKPGEQDQYSFTGTIGQRLYYDSLTDITGINVELLTPSGASVFSTTVNRDRDLFTLTENGIYRLVIDGSNLNTGDYRFQLLDAETAINLDLDTPIIDNLTPGKSTQLYQLTATGGQNLYFDDLGSDFGGNWKIYGTRNQSLISGSLGSDRQFNTINSGSYILAIQGNSDNSINYNFAIEDRSNPNTVPKTGFNEVITGTVNSGIEQVYNLTASTGLPIYFDSLNNSSTGVRVRLEDSNNNQIFNLNSTSNSSPIILTDSGEYRLIVSGNGDYSFRLLDLTTSENLTVNQVINEAIAPLETKIYKVNGTVGKRIYYDALESDRDNITINLLTPSNLRLINNQNSDSDSNLFTLEENGNYYLVIESQENNSSNYHFQIIDTQDAANLPLSNSINSSLNPGYSTQFYQFNASDNQRFYFENLGSDGGNWQIYNDANQRITSGSLNRDSEFIINDSGSYILAIQGNSDSPVNYNFSLVDASTNSDNLTLNQIINGSISQPGEQDEYTFEGNVGQRLYYDSLTNISGINAQLFTPSGVSLFNTAINRDTDLITLEETGTYRLIIDGSSENIGDYRFQLLDTNNGNNLSLDNPQEDSLTPGNSTKLYQFTLNQGQRLYFDDLGSDSGSWQIYNSSNQRVASGSLNGDREFILNDSGSYILAVQGNSDSPVNYNFSLVDASTNSDDLTLNQIINGSISQPGEQDEYTFEGNVGQRLYYDSLTNISGINAQLFTPSGVSLFNTAINRDTDLITVEETGTYRLVIDGSSESIGDYRFQLLDMNNGNNLSLDSPQEDSLTPGNSTQLYKFTLNQGQRLYFDDLGSDSGNWEIYNSSNQRVANGFLNGDKEFILNGGGNYILAIQGNSDSPINYNFSLVDASTNTINLILDQPINNSIAKLGEQDEYIFSGTIGQQIYYDALLDSSSNIRTQLISPSGQSLLSNHQTSRDIGPFSLTETGTYRFIVDASFDNIEEYSFQVHDLANTPLITPNTTLSDTLEPSEEVKIYRIEGTIGQELLFNLTEQSLFGTASELATLTEVLELTGGFEDGYDGIDEALSTLPFRDDAAVNLILVTDEDRDILDEQLTFSTILTDLEERRALLNSVISGRFIGEDDQITLGTDAEGNAYLADGNGDYTTIPLVLASGDGTTKSDYIDLSLATQGAAWDINQLREGGNTATSFTKAFVDIKAREILEQLELTVISSDPTVEFNNLTGIVSGVAGGEVAQFEAEFTGDGLTRSFDLLFVRPQTGTILGSIPVTINNDYLYLAQAVDPDEDSLTYSLINAPNGATINSETGAIDWKPEQGGDYQFTIQADDGRGGIATQDYLVTVTVGEPNQDPTITSIAPSTNAAILREYNYQVEGTDPDGDILSYYLNQAPEGMEINRQTGLITYTPTRRQLGEQTVEILVLDGRGGEATQTLTLEVTPDFDNQVPVINSNPVTQVNLGEIYQYQVIATDGNGDRITIDLPLKPEGMTIDRETGLIIWEPQASQIGSHEIVLRVKDDFGGLELQSFTLEVIVANNAVPIFTSIPPQDATPQINKPFTYQGSAIDPDGDEVSYSLGSSSLSGVNIDSETGLLTWRPNNNQLGEQKITIIASDGQGGSSQQILNLRVVETLPNRIPTITSTPRTQARVETLYIYQPIATDLDGDPLEFSLITAPDGMSLDNEQRIIWTPTATQIGDHQVVVAVNDGQGGEQNQSFTLKVQNNFSNQTPTITSAPLTLANIDQLYQYQVLGTDPDGDYLIWNLENSPEGMVIEEETGVISWQPQSFQLGSHEITVNVSDPLGFNAQQTYTLEVIGSNLPPTVTSIPETTAAVGATYQYQVLATDPENNPLTYRLDTPPVGMTIDSLTGEILWRPNSSQLGLQSVTVLVDDGRGAIASQNYGIFVLDNPSNQSPFITSTPSVNTLVDQLYTYQVTGVDPEGENLTFRLIENPNGMTINPNTGLIQWTPTRSQAGLSDITVEIVDPLGATGQQRFQILSIGNNQAPIVTSRSPSVVIAGETYQYDVIATDPDGDSLTYTLEQAPNGMSIDNLGRLRWLTTPTDAGIINVRLRVSDPYGGISGQNFSFNVVNDTQAPQVSIVTDANQVDVGETVTITVNAVDNTSIDNLVFFVDGVATSLNGNGQTQLTIEQIGAVELVASATDIAGNTTTVNETILGIDSSDTNAPQVSINNLENGDVITAPTDIIGSVIDNNLTAYRLEIAPIGSSNFTEIARGSNSVTDDVLGEFDPSTLLNDSYILRLVAEDAGGNQSVEQINVSVAEELKIGNYQLSFTDLTVPVTGIPIILTRTYNSHNAQNIDDFGYGWRMELRDTDLRTSVPETGFEDSLIYNPFFDGAKVYVTLPGGQREGFTFQPQPAPGLRGGFLGIWQPKFVADAGVTSELTVQNFDLSRTNTGEYLGFASSLGYNPINPAFGGTFTLTTKEGIIYEIDGNTGDTRTIRDRNGNQLTFTDGGVFSSTGQEITFERDAQRRITAVIDPNGNRIEYGYDDNGDLTTVTDREGNVTRFVYDDVFEHYLEEVIDPLGRTGARSEYDETGRLVKIIDADDQAVELIHDPDNFVQTVKDQLGNETIYEYDTRGNVVTEIDARGGVITRTYDEQNNLLTETDALGNTTTLTYDNRANILTETDPLGNVTRYTYNSFGDILTTIDPLGNTNTNIYDRNGNLTSISGQANGPTTFTYDGSGNLTSFGDAAGVQQFEYDSLGNITRQVDAEGHVTTFTYDANGNQITQTQTLTTPEGLITLVTTTEYDSEGRLIKVTDPEGGVTETIYDAVGNRIETIDPLGRSTKYVYNDRGELIETIYPDSTPEDDSDNPRTRTEYDAAGRVIAEIDELGRKTQMTYDSLGRVIEMIYPDDTSNDDSDNPRTRTEYDLAGRVIAEIDERGNRTEYLYDEAGRQIATILPDDTPDTLDDNPRFTNSYDAAGRQIAQTDALGNVTQSFYDDLGRLIGQEFADGTTIGSEFDETGRLTARTDQDGEITRYEYDALGRLTAVIDTLDQRTEYGYDEQGNLVLQKDANGNITRLEYDGLGRRVATVLPDGQGSTTEYNAIGNVIRTTDFNGDIITYEYDERNRLIAENFPDGSRTIYTYTLDSQRETVVDERGTTIYEYDAQNRLIERIDPDGTAIAYSYDLAGNRTSVEIPSGTTNYTFDELNRLETVIDTNGGVTTYFYNDNSNLIRTEFPNGTVETREYDTLNRLTYIATTDINGEIISSFRYELDAEGHRTQVTEQDGRLVKYYYDDLDRLTKEEIFDVGGTDATRTIEYTYDAVGNRLSRFDSGEGTTLYTYDNNDRLLTETTDGVVTTYSYDNNGNTVSKSTNGVTVTYEWNAENRLGGADTDGDGTVDVTNEYDADGIRVAQTVNGEKTRFLVDVNRPYGQVLEEYTPGGIIKVSYVHGHDLISQERNDEKSFYHVDGLGSTRALSDENGLLTDNYIYDAFGQVLTKIGDTENSYLFAGEQRDSNLGLDYLRARYLDVNTGRFVSRDSFEGFVQNPVTLHKYLYGNANPVNNIDPSGNVTLSGLAVAFGVVATLATIALGGFTAVYLFNNSKNIPSVGQRIDEIMTRIKTTEETREITIDDGLGEVIRSMPNMHNELAYLWRARQEAENMRGQTQVGSEEWLIARDVEYYFVGRYYSARYGAPATIAASLFYDYVKVVTYPLNNWTFTRANPNDPNTPPGGWVWALTGVYDGRLTFSGTDF